MHIVVGARSTASTTAVFEVSAEGGVTWSDPGGKPDVLNPWDEYAVEEAITQAKASGGTVTVLTIGPESFDEALRTALAMGANAAVRAWDPAWERLDSRGYAAVFAAAVQKLGDVELVIFGKEAADDATDAHIFQIGRKLGWRLLSYVSRITALEGGSLTVEQALEQGRQTATGPLPAVINVMKEINTPRYPSLIGIRKANKAEIPVWDAAALGVEAPAPLARTAGHSAPPAREGACEFIAGDSPQAQAALLVEKLLAEKVV